MRVSGWRARLIGWGQRGLLLVVVGPPGEGIRGVQPYVEHRRVTWADIHDNLDMLLRAAGAPESAWPDLRWQVVQQREVA